MDFFIRKKTDEELRDEIEHKRLENEQAELEMSLAQKREIIAKLKPNGLSLANFGNNLKAARLWLRTH